MIKKKLYIKLLVKILGYPFNSAKRNSKGDMGVLTEKLGAERCSQAKYGLHMLKKKIESYQIQGGITNVAIRNE